MNHDRYTGKPIDRPSDRMPIPNDTKCDICGGNCIDNCPFCGAPQCCPQCCNDATQYLLGYTHGDDPKWYERYNPPHRTGTRELALKEYNAGFTDAATKYGAKFAEPTGR